MDLKTFTFAELNNATARRLLSDGCSDAIAIDAHNRQIQSLGDLTELQTLKGLDQLRELREAKLYHNRLKNTDGVEGNKRIENLYLNDNHIKRMTESLLSLRALKMLRLDKNVISSIAGLDSCRSLTYLDLSQNKLKSLEGLSSCSALEQLNANENEIEDLMPLKNLKQLHELQVCGNQLRTGNGLEHLRSLSVLRISRNLINSLKTFPMMPTLSELYLDRNNLVEVANAAQLFPMLDTLDISLNMISDASSSSCLSKLDDFQQLWMAGNPCAVSDSYMQDIKRLIPNLIFLDDMKIENLSDKEISELRSAAASQRPTTASSRPRTPALTSARSSASDDTSLPALTPRSAHSNRTNGIPLVRPTSSRSRTEMRLVSAQEIQDKATKFKNALRLAHKKIDDLLTPRSDHTKSEDVLPTSRSEYSVVSAVTSDLAEIEPVQQQPSTTTVKAIEKRPVSPKEISGTPDIPKIMLNQFPAGQGASALNDPAGPEIDNPDEWLTLESPRFTPRKTAERKKPPSRVDKGKSFGKFRIPKAAEAAL